MEQYGYSDEQIKIIKNILGSKCSLEHLGEFLHICNQTKLDPIRKQIYGIFRSGKLCIQTSIDGFRLIADRTGRYAPGRDTVFEYDKNGKLISAKVYVKKMTPDGTWHELGAAADLIEYKSNNPFWSKMPKVMLSKVAEARALRRAFPDSFSGIYSDDEMDQANMKVEEVKEEVKEEVPLISKEKISVIKDLLAHCNDEFKSLMEDGINEHYNGWDGIPEKYADKIISRIEKEVKKEDEDEELDAS